MKEEFITKNFGSKSLDLIEKINSILVTYESQGYRLSLRQLYYQLVAANVVENTERSYKNIGNLVSDARLAGLVDWEMIEDRGRVRVGVSHWDSPADIVRSAAQSFAIDKWARQPNYVEVMVEKQALEGVLIPVCRGLDISFTANKGYSSSSALYEAGKRLADRKDEGKDVFIIYLGDHDPSGIDMTRDIRERLSLFGGFDGGALGVERVALNFDQIKKLRPPKNPAKLTDSRAKGYILEFGPSSWELDAIEPKALAKLVKDAVYGLRDTDLWAEDVEKENDMKAKLEKFADDTETEENKE
jgi:hypothetical protein